MVNDFRALKTHEIITRLKNSEYWTAKSKVKDLSIVNLRCPECDDLTAWAYTADPFSINCNRLDKCGARTKILSIFPEILQNIEKKHPPTRKDPHRPARYYLNFRGLNEVLDGLQFQHWKKTRKGCGGAVMFPVVNGNGETVYNGRLFNPPIKEGKTHNKGSTSGAFWKHPVFEYKANAETYVTEGIVDALSLMEMGKQAVAVLSAGQDPTKVDLSEYNKLIFAFDSDLAGANATKKWLKHYPDAKAIMPYKGDWNDILLCFGSKEDVLKHFDENMPEYEFQAKLALAEDAKKYAMIYYGFKKKPLYLFSYSGFYYYSYLKKEDAGEPVTNMVSNFTLSVDHYRLDTSNPDDSVYSYHLKIKPAHGRTIARTMSANELSSPQNLTNTFLHKAKVFWEGEKPSSRALLRRIVESNAPVVRQLQAKGHDKKSGCYVFRHFMINPKGEVESPNKHGFYRVSKDEFVRSSQFPDLKPVKGISPGNMHDLLYQAWGDRAAVGFAWIIAGWFVDEIKAKIKFFPLLSFYGDSQTGKTALTRLLNACQCLDEEGIPMKRANTEKGILRKLSQRAGLFQALLEENKNRRSKFDYRFCLTAYNDAPLQIRANKTLDNTTNDTLLLSTVLFVQNVEPFEAKPEKERVISLEFKKDQLSDNTTRAFNGLLEVNVEEFAHLYQFVMTQHSSIKKKWHDVYLHAKKDLGDSIRDARIKENHALILAFHRIFCKMAGIYHDLKPFIEEIGQKKIEACSKTEISIADVFLEAILENHEKFDYAEYDEDRQRLYVRMTHALGGLRELGIVIQTDMLLKDLREHPAYITHNRSYRFFNGSHKAWWFETGGLIKTEAVIEQTINAREKTQAEIERAKRKLHLM
jgi:hypothetical protein